MKKHFLYFILIISSIIGSSSCERDDICIDDTTPNFVLRFYDTDDPTDFKTVNQLSVKSDATEIAGDSLVFTSLDSIGIPVNVTTNMTQYVVTINSNDITTLNRDTITINYMPQEIFVGRACGFKSVFNNVTYTITNDSDNWIKSFEIVTETIADETNAHIKIFH